MASETFERLRERLAHVDGDQPRIDTLLRIAEALDCELVVELRRR